MTKRTFEDCEFRDAETVVRPNYVRLILVGGVGGWSTFLAFSEKEARDYLASGLDEELMVDFFDEIILNFDWEMDEDEYLLLRAIYPLLKHPLSQLFTRVYLDGTASR